MDAIAAAIESWKTNAYSRISDHGQDCCRVSRAWFRSMDYSRLIDGNVCSGPTWIRETYKWGPSKWPLYWCEVVESEYLDCGALAAVAREALLGRGLQAHPVQLIQQFSEQDIAQWREKWGVGGYSVDWILGNLVYHEASALVLNNNSLKIWDPTDNFWISPSQVASYAATLAICVHGTTLDSCPHYVWGTHSIKLGVWTRIVGCERQDGSRVSEPGIFPNHSLQNLLTSS